MKFRLLALFVDWMFCTLGKSSAIRIMIASRGSLAKEFAVSAGAPFKDGYEDLTPVAKK
jgi:hypothetical protein